MKDSWFRWEREASIHLLFPTLEAFYQPLFSYSGVLAPTMVLVFEKGVVTWCIKENEFIEYGRNLLEIYSNPRKEKKMVGDMTKALNFLKRVEARQATLDLKNVNDTALVEEHHALYQAFLGYYAMGAIGTPLSFAAETDLKAKGLTSEELNSLTTPNKISYISEADDFLRKTKNSKHFIQKYFWIHNNYSGTEIMSEKDVRERLASLVSRKGTRARVQTNKKKIKLSKGDVRLIELLKHYAVYKDDRKKEILIYLHYMDRILKEIARRADLSIDQVRASCPFEVRDIVRGELAQRELNERLRYSVVVWEKGKKNAKVVSGLKGRVWEKKTLTKNIGSSKIIRGTLASPGNARGRVRILLRAKDSDQLKKGEVLVTFMTSPDFMPAIRKCSAIVTNLGGVTCHAAIISRELKIPCVVGTKIATKVLRTGDLVEVDADQGVIKTMP